MSSSKETAPPQSELQSPAANSPPHSGGASGPGTLYLLAGTVLFLIAGGLSVPWWLERTKSPVSAADASRSEEIQAGARRVQECQLNDDGAGMERELLKLISLQPDFIDWRLNLCDLYSHEGRNHDALRVCREAMQHDFSNADKEELRVRMATQLMGLGQVSEMRRVLEEFREHSPQHPDLVPLWSQLLRLEGDSRAALNHLQENLLPEDESSDSLQLKGILEFDLGSYQEAYQSLRYAAERDPYSEPTQFKLAECARLLGDLTAEKRHRADYARLNSARREITRLLNLYQYHRGNQLTEHEMLRLASLYESTGQHAFSAHWRHKAAEQRGSTR